MKLQVDRLTVSPSKHRYDATIEWRAEWTGSSGSYAYTFVSGPSFVIQARVQGEDIHIQGRHSSEIEVECSRCIKRYRHALSDTFHLVLEPIRDRKAIDPEGNRSLERFGMCLSDELEAGWYRGKEISLDPFFSEVSALAMPVQPLCSENCAGLCPHCGIDRNRASCDCTEKKPESPFAVLAALRGGSDGRT